MGNLDQQIAATVRPNGVGIAHNLLTVAELRLGQQAFGQVYLDLDKGLGQPSMRDSIWGEKLLEFSAIGRMFSHPVSSLLFQLFWMSHNLFCERRRPIGIRPFIQVLVDIRMGNQVDFLPHFYSINTGFPG